MTQQLENSWIHKALTPEELKQYAQFETDLKQRFTETEKENFEIAWKNVVQEIQINLKTDPKSQAGMSIGRKVMDLINGLYGKEHANLKHSVWEKGFKQGHAEGEHVMLPEMVTWLDAAIDAYYRKRIYDILDQVENNPTQALEARWHVLLDEMYGNSKDLKQDLLKAAMIDERVSPKARIWLQKV